MEITLNNTIKRHIIINAALNDENSVKFSLRFGENL